MKTERDRKSRCEEKHLLHRLRNINERLTRLLTKVRKANTDASTGTN